MNDMNETTIFEEGGVKITNLRAMIGTNTYPISNITFVSRQKREPGSAPYWLYVVGGLFLLIGFMDINKFRVILILGLVLFFAGGYVIRTARTTYIVRIGNAGGETNILESQDRDYIKSIVEAMNKALSDAIVRRGEAADDLR